MSVPTTSNFVKRNSAVTAKALCWVVADEEIKSNTAIATRSCVNKKPTEILPYNLGKSPLSERSLRIIIVLLKLNAIPRYKACIEEKPNARERRNPRNVVMTICPSPPIKETFPTSLITAGLRLRPTINKRMVIPIFEKRSRKAVVCTRLSTCGPITIPVRIYPATRGCLSIRRMSEIIVVRITSVVNERKSSITS